MKFVTQWNAIHSGVESRTALGYVSRWEHYIGSGAVSDIVLSFDAWFLGSSSNGPCSNVGNDIPIVDCSLEYNGVTTPVTFGGSRSITLVDGSGDNQSDNINIMSAFGVAYLPVNARIDVKLKVLLTSTSQVMPASFRKTGTGIGQVWFYNPASTTISSTDDPGVYVATGAVQGRSTGYSPTILGTFTTDVKTLFIRGDSISAGTGDTGYNQSGLGWIQRAIGMMETPLAAYNGAVPSMKIEGGRTDARFINLYQYATDGIVAGATNNFGTTGTSATVSATLSSIGNAISEMKTGGMDKVGVMRLLPRTASTDNWATEANQTVSAGWNVGDRPDLYNQALLDGEYDFVILNNSVRGVDPIKWRVDGTDKAFASDAVHPSAGGHIAMATEAVPVIMNALFPNSGGGSDTAITARSISARKITARGITARSL